MILYGYFPFDRLDVLRNCVLPFEAVCTRDDPFELNRPAAPSPEAQGPITRREFDAEVRRQYEALPDHLQAMLPFNAFRDHAHQDVTKKAAFIQAIRQRRSPRPKLPTAEAYRALAVCNLYASATNPVLWERHADLHRGFVVGFDSRHESFSAANYRERPQALGQVRYSNERPTADGPGQPFPALFHQPVQWAHEQAWRLIRPIAAGKPDPQGGAGRYLYKFPATSVKAVVVGASADPQRVEELGHFLANDMRLKRHRLARCMPDASHYTLHIVAEEG